MKHVRNTLFTVHLVLALFLITAVAHAKPVIVGSDSTLIVDEDVYTLKSEPPNYTGLMWEDGNSGKQVCGCGTMAFRAMQAFIKYLCLGKDKISRTVHIETGWSTPGAEEMYVEKMGWTRFSYADVAADPRYLTIEDAWYRFTLGGRSFLVTSDVHNYRFTPDPNHPGYHADWDFFAYRTYAKTQASGPEKAYFRDVVRPQYISNLMGETVFDVRLEVKTGRPRR